VERVDHLDLVVRDLERSLAFYRGLLEPLGYTRTSEIEGERGERVVYLSRAGSVGLRAGDSDAHVPRPGRHQARARPPAGQLSSSTSQAIPGADARRASAVTSGTAIASASAT
jgi:catechol 2,3-dioxygenase-like lactoylglutathione lyase family enzyme